MVFIVNHALGGVKNLIISTESTIEILRLPLQNDITTQSQLRKCLKKTTYLYQE
jgi:hypothetical protein